MCKSPPLRSSTSFFYLQSDTHLASLSPHFEDIWRNFAEQVTWLIMYFQPCTTLNYVTSDTAFNYSVFFGTAVFFFLIFLAFRIYYTGLLLDSGDSLQESGYREWSNDMEEMSWDGLKALPIALASTHWSPVQPCANFLQQDGMIGMGAIFMAMKEHVSILLHRGRC